MWWNTIHKSCSRLITSWSWGLNQAIKADRLSAPPPIKRFSNIPRRSPHNICEGTERFPYHPNVDRETVTVDVVNHGDRPIQVGSHFHFFEVNKALIFERRLAFGKRLNIPAGTAVRRPTWCCR